MTETHIGGWPPQKQSLEELYWRRRLSLKQIGVIFGKDSSSVLQLLKQYKIRTRDLSEAMTKYPKRPSSGNLEAKSYLLGPRAGDLYAARHGKSIRVTVSTTHPAMIELIRNVFERYGRVVVAPKFLQKWNQFEWEVYNYLHPSFGFLLERPAIVVGRFLSFLAGFFDAKGAISIGKQHRSRTTRVSLEVCSGDHDLLCSILTQLRRLGYHPCLPEKPARRKGEIKGYGPYNADFWRLSINRKEEVLKLLSSLPIRHKEKTMKRELAIECHPSSWNDIAHRVRALRLSVKAEVSASVDEARRTYLNKRQNICGNHSPVV